MYFATDQLAAADNIITRLTQGVLSWRSLVSLVVCVGAALLIGRIIAWLLRRVVLMIGARADKSQNLHTVNRLRRIETFLVLSIAVIRMGLVLFSLYFWWQLNHTGAQPTALIGASAIALFFLTASFGPILRDLTSGSVMMAEQWYGVGDHVRLEPFTDLQGVVERVTLRSTRIRGLNGEVIWVNNQNIQGVRIAPRGIRTIALELFVNNPEVGEQLIEETNARLPVGPLLLVSPLAVIETAQVGKSLWQITAVAETAPGREWLIEKSAVELIQHLDEELPKQVISHGPLARYADRDAERRFKRTITNARKKPIKRKIVTRPRRPLVGN